MAEILRRRWFWLLIVATVASLASCSDKPEFEGYTNPLDPDEARPDPFNVQLSFEDGAVVLRWDPLHEQIPTITSYLIFRSSTPELPFTAVAEVPVDALFMAQYADADYARSTANYYYVAARSGTDFSGTSHIVVMSIRTAPTVELATGNTATGTRTPIVELRPQPLGSEIFELSFDASFSSVASYDSVAAATDPVLDLGPRGEGESIDLYSRVVRSGVPDTVGVNTVMANLLVEMTVLGRPDGLVTDTLLLVQLDKLEGVTRLRFAQTEPDLPTASWVIPDSTDGVLFEQFSIDIDALSYEVWGEFESDFGFTEMRDLEVEPLRTVKVLNFAAQDSATSDTGSTVNRNVRLASSTDGATQMRFSEDISFAGASWQTFSSSAFFMVSPELGTKIIYGQFRNIFSNVAADTASIILQAPPDD